MKLTQTINNRILAAFDLRITQASSWRNQIEAQQKLSNVVPRIQWCKTNICADQRAQRYPRFLDYPSMRSPYLSQAPLSHPSKLDDDLVAGSDELRI
jgi:hypothetical protein